MERWRGSCRVGVGREDCFLQREDLESATMWFRLGMERLRGFVRETGWRKTF
jgi:hypothetical protein